MVLFIHHRMMKERKIDEKVVLGMREEKIIGLLAILLIVIGYVLSIYSI